MTNDDDFKFDTDLKFNQSVLNFLISCVIIISNLFLKKGILLLAKHYKIFQATFLQFSATSYFYIAIATHSKHGCDGTYRVYYVRALGL